MPWKKKGTSTVSESGAALSATLATAGRRAQIKVNEPTFVSESPGSLRLRRSLLDFLYMNTLCNRWGRLALQCLYDSCGTHIFTLWK